MIKRQALVSVCFLTYFVAACDSTMEDSTGSTEDHQAMPEKEMVLDETGTGESMRKPETLDERRELRRQIAHGETKKLQGLDRVPGDQSDPVSGEVPDELLEKIIKDLMVKIAANRPDITVLHAESLTWNDGSLGCGKPGQVYTQAQVPGYRVILGHAGQQFDYRAAEHGFFVLCEQPISAVPGSASGPPTQ